MSLIDSLVTAILRSDGEAVVLHVGEKPYVVTDQGTVEMSMSELTFETISPMLEQLLSSGSRSQLDEFGAVEDELQTSAAPPGERFTVVAARGGEDIWIEMRRHRAPLPLQPDAATDPPAAVEEAAPEAFPESPEAPEARPTLVAPPAHRNAAAAFPAEEIPSEPAGPAGVVLPMRRSGAVDRPHDRVDRSAQSDQTGIERLLRLAASRKATKVYVVTGAKPSLRVDGEVRPLDMEPTFTTEDVEALVLAMLPDGSDAVRPGTDGEWVRDLPEVGRVRCTRFRDHRGPGAIFQLIGARAISADELGLPRCVRELAEETEGLILITGLRASGKSTLFAALVDLINRSRSAHVITLESQIKFVHENRQSIISQREVRGDHQAVLAMTRTALREAPDVLAIEDLRARDVIALALQAAESGHLVLGTIPSTGAVAAIERLVDQVADDRRSSVLRAVSDTLRGVAAQMLLRKIGGGRVAALELLRNTHSVASLIAEGHFAQLPRAMEHGRRAGMVTFSESLVELVRDKIVDVRDAYRHAPDRDAFVKLLEREGMDTSFVERMA